MLETADSFRNMGESQKYYVQKKPDTKVLAIWFHLYETRKQFIAWGQGGKAGVEVLIGAMQGSIILE